MRVSLSHAKPFSHAFQIDGEGACAVLKDYFYSANPWSYGAVDKFRFIHGWRIIVRKRL